jgi:hypothetical protein
VETYSHWAGTSIRYIAKALIVAFIAMVPFAQRDALAGGAPDSVWLNACEDSVDFYQQHLADAYEFGLKIQKYVQDEDLISLFGLVNGELRHGPRRNTVMNKRFSEVFSEQ